MCGGMEYLVSHGPLDELDGLNPSRALILQAYYALRRTYPPTQIGTPQISAWIKLQEPDEPVPSDSLILLTFRHTKLVHRPPWATARRPPYARAGAPLFSPASPSAPRQGAAVGTLLWPALLAEPLAQITTEIAALPDAPRDASLCEMHLGALAGRLMHPGGWVAGARHTGAEPIWTGRSRPYDESTLRKGARELAQRGGTELLANAVEATVVAAVAESTAKAVAFTDMYDQVYWTKKPSHAAPIGNRGNRLLAATYFGLTIVRPKNGPALAYHVSWHKPASPLQDGLEALHAVPGRAVWLSARIRRHIWDRGGSGAPTLRWALRRRIPYLTVSRKSAHWTRFRRNPRVFARSRIPVFVRRDVDVAKDSPNGSQPEVVIFPAHPRKGRVSTRALRYRTGTPLPKAELRELDRVYKSRWPSNENVIKALVAVGFDRNLDRGLTPITSRGTDGRLARLEAKEHVLHDKIEAFKPTTVAQAIRGARPLLRQKQACSKERTEIAAIPTDKGARMSTGAELLCKNLMLLMYNVLALLLMRSPLAEVRAMTPWRVQELLFARSFLGYQTNQNTTLWIDPVPAASERVLQVELVRLLNERSLSVGGQYLRLRISDTLAKTSPLRLSG